MISGARLILAIHNHQPVGNFDHVIEHACQDAYFPLLDLLDEFPEISVVLHNSGSLLEWLMKHQPRYVDRLAAFVESGQIELLGGPFYEPILASIPRRDRVGQVASYKSFLERRFEAPVRGAWVPERVWEQSFAGDLIDAGVEYVLLDDAHFRAAGLRDDELHGYYLTEDSGRKLCLFPGSERLRYLIPYADPQEVVEYCRQVADHSPGAVLTFGDDGEKFGVWPGSKEHVYTNGWLRRFFVALREQSHWLKVTTMAETIRNVAPRGRTYLPDGSYREMTEWALPADRQLQYQDAMNGYRQHHDWPQLGSFIRAGFWRNFLVKYPETNEMYTRMLGVSQRLADSEELYGESEHVSLLRAARTDLYRAQCNCSYWHGAFGGLYLPHLRNAVYSHLIAADHKLDQLSGKSHPWVEVTIDDYNCDAKYEVRLASDKLKAFFSPSQGGHMYELDVTAVRHNLLSTLNRRFEPYHEKIRRLGGSANVGSHGGGVDPNGGINFKQAGLDQKLRYDQWARKSLVDHFLQPGLSLESFVNGEGSVGDFATGPYKAVVRRSETRVETQMTRDGHFGPYAATVRKTISLDEQSPGELVIKYELSGLPQGLPLHFGVEFNFAGLAGSAPDRYLYDSRGRSIGTLDSSHSLPAGQSMGLVDEWLGIDVNLDASHPAEFWIMPIQTVSQSEGGFELVHQSTAVVSHWEFFAPENGRWSVELKLSVDTSVAQARALQEEPARRSSSLALTV
ncbi:MAG: alpha-amylase [Planctomyces sp.]|nr:alpha-amylase [Planctomyces sp.]